MSLWTTQKEIKHEPASSHLPTTQQKLGPVLSFHAGNIAKVHTSPSRGDTMKNHICGVALGGPTGNAEHGV